MGDHILIKLTGPHLTVIGQASPISQKLISVCNSLQDMINLPLRRASSPNRYWRYNPVRLDPMPFRLLGVEIKPLTQQILGPKTP